MSVSVDQIVTRCFNLERVRKEVAKVGKAPPELMKLHIHMVANVCVQPGLPNMLEPKDGYRETLFGSRMILDIYFVCVFSSPPEV